jgi:hypothetical protein
MTDRIITAPVESLAALDLAIGYVEQARDLISRPRLPTATECRSLEITADQLRALRAKTRAQPLPPDPEGMNDRRAAWAGQAIAAFIAATGTDQEDAVCDLLADLMHWCDRHGQDFGHEQARAQDHYDAETFGDESTN